MTRLRELIEDMTRPACRARADLKQLEAELDRGRLVAPHQWVKMGCVGIVSLKDGEQRFVMCKEWKLAYLPHRLAALIVEKKVKPVILKEQTDEQQTHYPGIVSLPG